MRNETIQSVQTKFSQLQPFLSERARRLWAATEAKQLGWGGVSLVEQATGISHKTIRKGIAELHDTALNPLETSRSSNSGGGRKKCTVTDSHLLGQLEALIEPVRGNPESPLRWTCKSLRWLARELTRQGHQIGITSIRLLLHELEYSLQGNAKTREGTDGVNIGINHDTAQLAAHSIRRWWELMGQKRFPKATFNHGRCRRQQRLSNQIVENGITKVGKRSWIEHYDMPFSSRHEQVEQD